MAKKFLTLNIGAATIELAEYEAGAKGALTLVNYGVGGLSAPLDGGNAGTILVPALMEIVRATGIKPGPLAIAVSGQMAFQRFAAIPAAGGEEKFEQMIRYEIEQNIPFPIDEMVCDRQVVGDAENGDKTVLIVAAKVDQIEALTTAVASVGFVPELVDVAPLALTNALLRGGDDGSCQILLDIGSKTTSLVIVEGDKLYNRSIPVAGNTITKEIVAALGCTAEEAEALKCEKGYVSLGGVTEDEDEVADRISKVCRAVLTRLNAEISRSINFYRSQQGGGAPTRLMLTGGTALLPQLDVFFAESLGIEVSYLNPFELIGVSPKLDESRLEADGALIAATAGLAAHLAGEVRFDVNLLPPSIVAERAEKAKIPFLAGAGLSLAAALALVMMTVNRDTEVLEAQCAAVEGKVAQLQNFDRQIAQAETQLAAETAAAEKVAGVMSDRSKALQRLIAVRESLLPGMWIEKWEGGRITIRFWRDRVQDSGGKTQGERVVEKLKSKSAVDRDGVKISEMSSIGRDGAVVQVAIEVKFK